MRLRRYANRQMRDVDSGAWVTLDEVANAVRRGEPVSVTLKDNRDCTARVLLQILVENVDRGAQLDPALLVPLIRSHTRAHRSPALKKLDETIFGPGGQSSGK